MPIRLETKQGKSTKRHQVYTKSEVDALLSIKSRRTSRGSGRTLGGSQAGDANSYLATMLDRFYADLESVGEITSSLDGTYTSVSMKLKGQIMNGTDYYIINENKRQFITVTATVDIGPGTVDVGIQEQVIKAPSGSKVTKVPGQDQAKQQKLDKKQGDLDSELTTLDEYINDPGTIPDTYSFFDGIVAKDAFVKKLVARDLFVQELTADTIFGNEFIANHINSSSTKFDQSLINKLTADTVFTDKLGANSAFITQLFTQQITISSDAESSGYIQSDGFLSGSKGFKIDYAGNAEFNSAVVRNGNLAGGDFTSKFFIKTLLEMGTDGKITNANNDYKITNQGFDVEAKSGFGINISRGFTVTETGGAGTLGALYGETGSNSIVLSSESGKDIYLIAQSGYIRTSSGPMALRSMGDVQRDNLTNVPDGTIIYNNDDGRLQYWDGGVWRRVGTI